MFVFFLYKKFKKPVRPDRLFPNVFILKSPHGLNVVKKVRLSFGGYVKVNFYPWVNFIDFDIPFGPGEVRKVRLNFFQ